MWPTLENYDGDHANQFWIRWQIFRLGECSCLSMTRLVLVLVCHEFHGLKATKNCHNCWCSLLGLTDNQNGVTDRLMWMKHYNYNNHNLLIWEIVKN